MLSLATAGAHHTIPVQIQSGAERSGSDRSDARICKMKNRISKARIRYPIPAHFRKIMAMKFWFLKRSSRAAEKAKERGRAGAREGAKGQNRNISIFHFILSLSLLSILRAVTDYSKAVYCTGRLFYHAVCLVRKWKLFSSTLLIANWQWRAALPDCRLSSYYSWSLQVEVYWTKAGETDSHSVSVWTAQHTLVTHIQLTQSSA